MSAQTGQLRQGTRNSQQPLRLLGIFAHPDDETFCIGGTVAKYIASGAEAMVVSFTRGEAGQIRDAAVATRRTLGEKRARELHLACHALGVQHVRCLDYGDGKLNDIPQTQLVGQAVEIIREFRPHIVFTFDETGAYGHPDHIAICHATTTACRVAGDPDHFPEHRQSGLLPHAPERLYHCHFPQSGRLLLRLGSVMKQRIQLHMPNRLSGGDRTGQGGYVILRRTLTCALAAQSRYALPRQRGLRPCSHAVR